MSRWSKYFTQPVSVRMYIGRANSYGTPEYDEARDILCRVEYARANVINKDGEQVVSEIELFSDEEIKAGSTVALNGIEWPVLSCATISALDGTIDHYEMRV